MAIPFNLPVDDETARLEMTLEQLLVDLFDILRQLALSTGLTNPQAALPSLPIIAPVGRPAAAVPRLVACVKSGAPPASAAAQRQSWQQLGAELRLLADQFSDKQSSQAVLPARQSVRGQQRARPSSVVDKLLGLLLPKTIGYSAAIIFVGLRFVKHKFA